MKLSNIIIYEQIIYQKGLKIFTNKWYYSKFI